MPVTPASARRRPNGFQPSDRLRQASEYKAVFDRATRAADQNFTLLGRRNSEQGARLGLAISVRAAGNAVVRNRVKRAARERFRLLREELGNIDVIVMARQGIKNKTRAEMHASLDQLFRSINRKCAQS